MHRLAYCSDQELEVVIGAACVEGTWLHGPQVLHLNHDHDRLGLHQLGNLGISRDEGIPASCKGVRLLGDYLGHDGAVLRDFTVLMRVRRWWSSRSIAQLHSSKVLSLGIIQEPIVAHPAVNVGLIDGPHLGNPSVFAMHIAAVGSSAANIMGSRFGLPWLKRFGIGIDLPIVGTTWGTSPLSLPWRWLLGLLRSRL